MPQIHSSPVTRLAKLNQMIKRKTSHLLQQPSDLITVSNQTGF